MYYSTEPFAEIIVDRVVWALRKSAITEAEDVAVMLDVDRVQLSGALVMLTGMTLHQIIREWRLLQAQELIKAGDLSLNAIARKCGWKNERVLKKIMRTESLPISI